MISWFKSRSFIWIILRIKSEYLSPSRPFTKLIKRIWISKKNSTQLLQQNNLFTEINTLYLFIDLQIVPIAYDVAGYLAAAEIERRRRNLKFIKIIVVPGKFEGMRLELSIYDSVVNIDARRWRLWNLIIPMFELLPSFRGLTICGSRKEGKAIQDNFAEYVFPADWNEAIPTAPSRREIYEYARQGGSIYPLLSATPQSLKNVNRFLEHNLNGRKLIVITLRNYQYSPQRNSNTKEWVEFVKMLDSTKYFAVFILDSEDVYNPINPLLKNQNIFLDASLNVSLRMAIYELAYLNLGIIQGPMELCWYNEKCRYLIFLKINSSYLLTKNQLESEGILLGESLPFANKFQRWVWAKDDKDLIAIEFTKMAKEIENKDDNNN